MGPLLDAISPKVPGSLGEPADGSALCLGMAGPPKGLERRLSVRLSVRAWLLAPQGSKDSTFSFFQANFLFGRENRKTPGRKWSSSCSPLWGKTHGVGDSHSWVSPTSSSLPPLCGAQEGTWVSLL